jgi:hypothetical protein
LVGKRTFVAAMAAVSVMSSGLLEPGVAVAATADQFALMAAGTGAAVDRAAADRAFVRFIAARHPQGTVRAAAWLALTSSTPDAAVAQFLGSGYEAARARAATRNAQNLDFAKRILATHTAEYAPEVNAASRRAVNGSNADREQFSRTGYRDAAQRDRQVREATGTHAAALVQADRDYVAVLRDYDPGAQVRVGAGWALRTGATDADLVEFFAYGWASAARLDLEMHQSAIADSDVRWRKTVNRLVVEAQAAEQAAREAQGEAAVAARASAASAWRAVGTEANPARSAWTDAEQLAATQAATWQAIALAAAGAESVNWESIAASSVTTEAAWSTERETAAEQARYWNALLGQARAAELEMTDPAS